MKKNILILACLSTTLAHAMEIVPSKKNKEFSIVSHGTTIRLTRKSLFEVSDVDLTVVGMVQQNRLQPPSFSDSTEVGRIAYCAINDYLYEKDTSTDSASDDDTYKPFSNEDDSYKNVRKKLITSQTIAIIEPRIMDEDEELKKALAKDNLSPKEIEEYLGTDWKDSLSYSVTKKISPDESSCPTYYGDEATTEALKDLTMCYSAVLDEGLKHNHKSIALGTLGADVGLDRKQAAPIAVAAVLDYVENNPHTYNLIELFVKKRSEFELYKNLLQQHPEDK